MNSVLLTVVIDFLAMAGDAPVDESKLTGLSKIFNGQTLRGRANVWENAV